MICIENLQHTFNAATAREQAALKDLNLEIQDQDILVIIGPNGCGKSTLLKLIAGQIKLQKGRISFNEKGINSTKAFITARHVAMVSQDPLTGTAGDLSILENLRLAYLRDSKRKLIIGLDQNFRDLATSKLKILNMGLEHRMDTPVESLSGGQRQALTLVMASMCSADILLMDEPTAALDPHSAEVVMNAAMLLIEEMKVPAILVTHNMQQALRYGNRLLLMDQGTITKHCDSQEKSQLNVTTIRSWFGDSL